MSNDKTIALKIENLIERLQPIAAVAEREYWLDSELGFDECFSYCWDCAMEEIGWMRWQLRLCLWSALDYSDSHGRELQMLQTHYPDRYPVRMNYCLQALNLGWKLTQFIWEKGNTNNWWIEGRWVWAGTEEEYYSTEFYENLPHHGWQESDGIENCECCGKLLDTCLTEYGVEEELSRWHHCPPTLPLSGYEARELEMLLTSIVSGLGVENCDRAQLESLIEKLQPLL